MKWRVTTGIRSGSVSVTRAWKRTVEYRTWMSTGAPALEAAEEHGQSMRSGQEAARLAAKDRRAGAVGAATAAGLYGLHILVRNIEDDPQNTTRFLVLGERSAEPSGKDKTSLILSTRNEPGAMHQMLTPLAANGVTMTRFESRPARTGLWEYAFYVDIEGHERDPAVAKALGEMRSLVTFLKVLGSYPAAAV